MSLPVLLLSLALSHVLCVLGVHKDRIPGRTHVVIGPQGLEQYDSPEDGDSRVVRRGGHATFDANTPGSTPHAIVAKAVASTAKPVGVCIGSVAIGERALRIRNRTVASKARYAKKHGYRFIDIHHEQRMPYVEIIALKWAEMKKGFSAGCNWIFWMDADSVFVNVSQTIEGLAEEGKDFYFVSGKEPTDSTADLPVSGGLLLIGASYRTRTWVDDMANVTAELAKQAKADKKEHPDTINQGFPRVVLERPCRKHGANLDFRLLQECGFEQCIMDCLLPEEDFPYVQTLPYNNVVFCDPRKSLFDNVTAHIGGHFFGKSQVAFQTWGCQPQFGCTVDMIMGHLETLQKCSEHPDAEACDIIVPWDSAWWACSSPGLQGLGHRLVNEPDLLNWTCGIPLLTVVATILVIYADQGLISSVVVFAFAASFTAWKMLLSYTNKDGFPYPLFTTAVQMLFTTAVSCAVARPSFEVAERQQYIPHAMKIAAATLGTFAINNVVLAKAGNTGAIILMAFTPLVVVRMATKYGIKCPESCRGALTLLVVGTWFMAVAQQVSQPGAQAELLKILVVKVPEAFSYVAGILVGQLPFLVLGVGVMVLANHCRSLTMVLTERCLVPMNGSAASGSRLCAPVKLLSYVSLPCSIGLFASSLLVEGLAPFQVLPWSISSALSLSCIAAFGFNVLMYHVVRMLGAVETVVACQGAVILLKMVPVALLQRPVTFLDCIGTLLLLVGMALIHRSSKFNTGFLAGLEDNRGLLSKVIS